MAGQDRAQLDWERNVYPIGEDCYAPAGTDMELCRDRIFQDATRLFSDESGGVEILWVSQSGQSNAQSYSRSGRVNTTYVDGTFNRRFVESSELETTGLNTVRASCLQSCSEIRNR